MLKGNLPFWVDFSPALRDRILVWYIWKCHRPLGGRKFLCSNFDKWIWCIYQTAFKIIMFISTDHCCCQLWLEKFISSSGFSNYRCSHLVKVNIADRTGSIARAGAWGKNDVGCWLTGTTVVFLSSSQLWSPEHDWPTHIATGVGKGNKSFPSQGSVCSS